MLHAVEKQGKYRYKSWRRRELIVGETGPVYLSRKSHPDSKKMAVEEVQIWPHYDRFLITESMNSNAAKRTVVLRGRLAQVDYEDLEYIIAAVKRANAKATGPAAAPPPTSAMCDGLNSPPSVPALPSEKQHSSTPNETTPSQGNTITSEEEDDDDSSSSNDDDTLSDLENGGFSVEPMPASQDYPNPLVTAPPSRYGGSFDTKHLTSLSSGSPGLTSATTGHTGDFESASTLTGHLSRPYASSRFFDGDEGSPATTTTASRGGAFAQQSTYSELTRAATAPAARMSNLSKHRYQWVVRCSSLDTLRALLESLQGFEEHTPAATEVMRLTPKPETTKMIGSFGEVEEAVRRAKEHGRPVAA